jgi:hypothetical protein
MSRPPRRPCACLRWASAAVADLPVAGVLVDARDGPRHVPAEDHREARIVCADDSPAAGLHVDRVDRRGSYLDLHFRRGRGGEVTFRDVQGIRLTEAVDDSGAGGGGDDGGRHISDSGWIDRLVAATYLGGAITYAGRHGHISSRLVAGESALAVASDCGT